MIEMLKNRHAGEMAYIVGKGPSLAYLQAEHFGKGPVIALNQSIVVVERLGILNPIYSLQKDGCGLEGPHERCLQREGHDWMIRPQKASLILQETEGYSRDCLADYSPRLLVCPVRDLGFEFHETMAIRMAVSLAKRMGCAHIKFVCCGSLVTGDTRTFNVWTGQAEQTVAGNHYLHVKRVLPLDLAGTPYSYFIPRGNHAN